MQVGRCPLFSLSSCLFIAKWASCYFISPLSEIVAASRLDMSPRGQHVRRAAPPSAWEKLRGFSDCCLPGAFFPPLNLYLCLPFSLLLLCKNFPATSWKNLQLLQCLCERKINTLEPWEPAEKLSRFGSRWELAQILSWIGVDFQPLHCAHQTLGLCLFTASGLSPLHGCRSCFTEKQNMMLTVPQKVLNVGAFP